MRVFSIMNDHLYSVGDEVVFSSTNMRGHTITGTGEIRVAEPDGRPENPWYIVKLFNDMPEIGIVKGSHIRIEQCTITKVKEIRFDTIGYRKLELYL